MLIDVDRSSSDRDGDFISLSAHTLGNCDCLALALTISVELVASINPAKSGIHGFGTR